MLPHVINFLLILGRPNDVTFQVAAEDITAIEPLRVGDIVSFSYNNLSPNQVPVGLNVFRVRRDLSWNDAISDFSRIRK